MIRIEKAGYEQLQLVHDMAQVVFRYTYRDILSAEQMEYMMDWMYSMPNLEQQIKEGHHYYVAYEEAVPCGYVSVQYEGKDADGMPSRIELNVNKYNKAVDFYKHIGMRVLLEEDFPIGNGFYKTDYIMRLDI